MHYGRLLGAGMLAGLLVACGSAGNSPLPVQPNAPSGISSGPAATPTTVSSTTTTTATLQQFSSFPGTVAGTYSGGFVLYDTAVGSKVDVAITSSTTVNTDTAPLATGSHTIVLGTGSTSTSISASYVALYPTTPGTLTFSGSVSGDTTYGFLVKTSAAGTVPVLVDTKSGLTSLPAAGTAVTVSGIGTLSEAVLARSVSVSSTSTSSSYPTSISQTHVLTTDYLGSPWGTTSVSASQAKPYLTWAQTGISNANAFSSAGLKVQVYFDPNRAESTDPLYSSAGGAIAQTCTSGSVTDTFSGLTQYVMTPASSILQSAYRNLIEQKMALGHIDAAFEDNAGPLSDFGSANFKASLPCNYTDSGWLTGGKELEAAAPVPTIFNGLSGLNGHNPSLSIGLLDNSSTIGGNFEHCFTENANPEQGAWLWEAVENTQLQVLAKGKLFQCEARNLNSASSSIAARIYTIASFLLTYNPSRSMLWEQFATTSGFNVMPESRLVPMYPVVSTPTAITGLQSTSGPFVREYHECYLGGNAIGACAMVVNNSYYSAPFPQLSLSYRHTLVLHGSGVLDGGYVTQDGALPAAGSTMANQSAAVLVQ